MKITRRFGVLMIALICLFSFLPVTVQANSPPPMPCYEFELTDLPDGTVYVDLLIELSESDSDYTELESDNLPEYFSAQAEIIRYCEDNFRSYTFHYKNAKSVILLNSDDRVYFFVDDYEDYQWEHKEKVEGSGWIRLAMLDKDGNILKVSSTFSVKPRKFLGVVEGSFRYNAGTDEFAAETDVYASSVILYIILCIIGLVLTCLVEYLITIPFGIRKKHGGLTVWVNLISQLLMHACYILLYGILFWRYSFAVIVLEILVYTGEFLVYRRKMTGVSFAKCIGYTIAANSVSLLLGLLLI